MSDPDYDIQEAFRRIELELISSMRRNLSKHQEWETKEGINWNMWQAEQLKDMRRFQQQNEKIFGKRFVQINNRVENLLKETAGLQDFEQERQSLEEMINNASLARSSSEAISGGFFGVNDRRMMALIRSTENDLKKAEHAMLRMTNDQYRKVIFNAQTYFNSGAGTLDKAIDMATDEFLKRGINCIEYKDGRRVNIATYAEMALRTANKRAGLMADGDRRAAMGIHLVKISSYGACSPTCMPWQGRIYVDDVYSGGTKEEAKELGYPLLSKAMEGGLFHPNCRHTASTYYPGLELTDDGDPRDASKIIDLKEHPDAERYHNYYQNLIQREKRLQVGSLDEVKIQEHADREAELVILEQQTISSSTDNNEQRSDNSLFVADIQRNWDKLQSLQNGLTKKEIAPILEKFGFNKEYYICDTPDILQKLGLINQTQVVLTRDNLGYFISRHNRQLTQFDFEHIKDTIMDYDLLLHADHRYGTDDFKFYKLYQFPDGVRAIEVVIVKENNSDELIVHVDHIGRKKHKAEKKYKSLLESNSLIDKKR